MYIQTWGTKDWKKDDVIEQIKDENEKLFLTKMLQELGENSINLSTVEIETVNRCNNDCSFCPVSVGKDIRPLLYMEDSLFKKIISDLERIEFSGVLSLFSNNEPLIDRRIFDYITYAKEKLPNATHALFTNGLLLTREKYIFLTEVLDYLVIDNYNDDLKLNQRVQDIFEFKEDKYRGCKVMVQNRKKNQVLLNRGTLSPNQGEGDMVYSAPCILPYIQMIIRPDGKVSRCCQDAYGNETLGDLRKQSIEEIWNGSAFGALRKKVLKSRNERDFCKNCDMLGLVNYFPDYWLESYQHQLLVRLREVKSEKRKLVLFNYSEVEALAVSLRNCGVTVDYVVTNENIEEYIKKDFYIVLDKYDTDVLHSLERNGMKCIKDYIVYNSVTATNLVRNVNETKYDIERLKEASSNNELLVYGAGETARKIIGYYLVTPTVVVDSYKRGLIFEEKYRIQRVEDIKNIEKYTILIAAVDYYSIMKRLSKVGVKASKVIIGVNLI
ncbi:MAG: SPASM domain-containing protein [Lachnospiraceae bacterium]|nr:SPASM domain-containing protein [Lachnospiraceae bacterium]